MKITSKQLRALKSLYYKHKKLSESISNAKKTFQDRYGKSLVKLERDGKKIELEENTLWVEIFHGGTKTQAGEIMTKKYPKLFEMYRELEKLNSELNIFTAKNWGFFYQQMSLVLLIDIILALIKYQLNPINWFRK